MRVSLGTVEVEDLTRRAIRHHVGKKGLATRKEVREAFIDHASAVISDMVQEYRNEFGEDD